MMSRLIFLFSLLLSISFVSFSQTPSPQAPAKEKAPLSADAEKIRQDLAEALKVVEENHVNGKTPDYNKLFIESINSMLHALDPHSNYLDPAAAAEFNSNINAQYFGIGFFMDQMPGGVADGYQAYVRETFENSPAYRAGLRYGDKILEINGVSMQGKTRDEVRGNVIGPRGTTVKMVVERAGKRASFEIVRDAISLPSIPLVYMIRPEIGYIAMTNGFTETTGEEFQRAMKDLKKKGMRYLLLDLRGNFGGLAKQARIVAETVLPRGKTIYTERGRAEKMQKYVSKNDSPYEMPIVVLIDRNSASASEILSGALQDNDRALFIGETTFGKGLIQVRWNLDKGSLLLLTMARYETPSGRIIQRDYSGSLYGYYESAGNYGDETQERKQFKTGAGRVIYGGGGIAPDVPFKPEPLPLRKTRMQNRLRDPILAFSFNLTGGKIAGFETYKIDRPIAFNYDLKETDFPIGDALFQAFRVFAAEKYKIPEPEIEGERAFVERSIRAELATAAYGVNAASRIFNEADESLKKAVELLPQAKEMAIRSFGKK